MNARVPSYSVLDTSARLIAVFLLAILSGCAGFPGWNQTAPADPEPVVEKPVVTISPLKKLETDLDSLGFELKTTDRGLVVFLPSLFFATNSSNLRIEAQEKIQLLGEVINRSEYTGLAIAVEGHTDALGDDEYNMELSRQRAEAVADHLVFNNVSTGRIEIAWFGETAPIAPNRNANGSDNPKGRERNRRVEFIITERGKS